MKIKVKDGVIYIIDRHNKSYVIDAPLADRIAYANGLQWAENFVTKYLGRTLKLDNFSLKIVEI